MILIFLLIFVNDKLKNIDGQPTNNGISFLSLVRSAPDFRDKPAEHSNISGDRYRKEVIY